MAENNNFALYLISNGGEGVLHITCANKKQVRHAISNHSLDISNRHTDSQAARAQSVEHNCGAKSHSSGHFFFFDQILRTLRVVCDPIGEGPQRSLITRACASGTHVFTHNWQNFQVIVSTVKRAARYLCVFHSTDSYHVAQLRVEMRVPGQWWPFILLNFAPIVHTWKEN